MIGHELGLVKLGNVFIDGTKVQANASRHKAMSYKRMKQLEVQLEAEIEDQSKDDIPDEIKRRKDRLKKITEAKKVIEQRRKEAYAQEKNDCDQKQKDRKKYEDQTGKKSRGRALKKPSIEPQDKTQYNFTDPESRIMKTNNGFNQCYNAQAAVNQEMIIVGNYVNANCNDKKEFLTAVESIPDELKADITNAVADTGYFSKQNIEECPKNITPIIARSKEKHNSYITQILDPKTDKEKDIYRKRKHTVEPVFGIIKEVLGFRRFSLRGEANTDNEWALVCLAYNLKRMFKLSIA